MFQKKCMVVGSLLVMAAQTVTAQSSCSGMTDLKATICGQNGYSGEYVDNPGGVFCDGNPCNNNDAVTCCKPAALCSTTTADVLCTDPAVYVEALIGGAFCKLLTCATSGDTSIDEARCCVPRANCDTIAADTAATFCAGDAYTGAFKSADAHNRCAGATCVSGDAAACCIQKATCDSLNDNSASPNLATVCGSNAAYTGALIGAGSDFKCATATCQTSDANACCKPATAKCNSITGSDVQTICAAPGYTGLNNANVNSDCAGADCNTGDAEKCCTAASSCTSDYSKDDMVASGAGTARGATITFTCDSGYAATESGVATCESDGSWSGGRCEKIIPICSVADGSAATPWITGTTAQYESCTCTGAAKSCSTLNVCDVVKKTCVCTPGTDHWCYEDSERAWAVKFGCFAEGEGKFRGYKCDGDNVLEAQYSDAACTSHTTPANGGEDKTFSATEVTSVKKDDADGTVKTEETTTITGTSTCKGGVAGAGAAAPGAAAPSPAAPSPAGTSPSATLGENAGSVTQCSTLAMLIVVAAMWAGRN